MVDEFIRFHHWLPREIAVTSNPKKLHKKLFNYANNTVI